MMLKNAYMLIAILAMSSMVFIAAVKSDTVSENEMITDEAITGTVIDANSGEGISGAEVTINEADVTETTDENGTFSFSDIQSGSYTLEVNADGYETTQESIDFDGENQTVEIQLEPNW